MSCGRIEISRFRARSEIVAKIFRDLERSEAKQVRMVRMSSYAIEAWMVSGDG